MQFPADPELASVLDGLPQSERARVRARHGLPEDGQWNEVSVLSARDVLADISDFEDFLCALVELEDPCRSYGMTMPNVHLIRQLVFECLQPLHRDRDEIFDVERAVFYDATQHAHLKRRIARLLDALHACQTLHMCEPDLRRYCESQQNTHQELHNTRLFIQIAHSYNSEFRLA
jgi:hypothetical protein